MKWTETHAGVINAASQRLWVALDEDADTVAIRMNTDPAFVEDLALYARNKCLAVRDVDVFSHSTIIGKVSYTPLSISRRKE